MSPLYRIGVFVAGAAVWAGVAAAWVFVSPAVAIAAAAGGTLTALVATLELRPPPSEAASSDVAKPEEQARDGAATGSIRLRDRDAIAREAARSRGED